MAGGVAGNVAGGVSWCRGDRGGHMGALLVLEAREPDREANPMGGLTTIPFMATLPRLQVTHLWCV